jgi:hypothetical protein
VRVLCVPKIDPALAERLRQGRDDFHIVGLDTPSGVVEQIERLTGRVRSRRRPQPSRMYLAQPTLVEQQLVAQRSWGWAAVAAVLLLAVGTVGGATLGDASSSSSPVAEPTITVRAPTNPAAPPRRQLDSAVLSAVAPIDPDVLDQAAQAPSAVAPARR